MIFLRLKMSNNDWFWEKNSGELFFCEFTHISKKVIHFLTHAFFGHFKGQIWQKIGQKYVQYFFHHKIRFLLKKSMENQIFILASQKLQNL